jgi:hypothetical protein
VTQQQVRRAIYYGDRYIDKLTETINWKGRTITLLKSFPSLPILVWNKSGNFWSFPGGTFFASYNGKSEIYRAVNFWGIETLTGDQFKGYYCFLKRHPKPDEVGKFKLGFDSPCIYVDYHAEGTDVVVNLTFGWSKTPCAVYVGKNLIWETNSADEVPADPNKTFRFPFGDGLRSHRYVIDYDLYMYALYAWYDRPTMRGNAQSIFKFLDDYGYGVQTFYDPLYRQTDSLNDDWLLEWCLYPEDYPFAHLKILRVNDKYKYCYESWKKGYDGYKFEFPMGGPPWWDETGSRENPTPYFPHLSSKSWCMGEIAPALQGTLPFDSILAMRAVHIMNKYNDPTKKDDLGNTAYDYLINGYRDWRGALHPPIKNNISSQGYLPTGSTYYFSPAYILPAFAELGYGFGNSQAKTMADLLADCLIKSQWGYQSNFLDGTYATEDYGVINRPEHIGGFIKCWTISNGAYLAADVEKLHRHIESISEVQGFSPLTYYLSWENLMFTPTTAQWTLAALRALRIYEAYKFRIGGT